MVPFPTLPTESLYKFMAIAGLITIVASFIYFTSQNQEISIDTIKLTTNSELYARKIDASNKFASELLKEYDIARKQFRKDTKRLNEAKRSDVKRNEKTLFIIDGKTYSKTTYENYLGKKLNAAGEEFQKKVRELESQQAAADVEKIKLKGQEDLIDVNNKFLGIQSNLYYALLAFGFLIAAIGFRKWYQMQIMADDLLKYQLAKAKIEQEQAEALRVKELASVQPELVSPTVSDTTDVPQYSPNR
jgi:hypothetical protein